MQTASTLPDRQCFQISLIFLHGPGLKSPHPAKMGICLLAILVKAPCKMQSIITPISRGRKARRLWSEAQVQQLISVQAHLYHQSTAEVHEEDSRRVRLQGSTAVFPADVFSRTKHWSGRCTVTNTTNFFWQALFSWVFIYFQLPLAFFPSWFLTWKFPSMTAAKESRKHGYLMLRQLHKLAESPRKEQKAQRCSTPFSEGLILGYQCWLQVHSLYKRVSGFHYLAFLLLQWVMFELLPEPDEVACPSLGHMWTEQKRCQAEGAHWKRENSVPVDLHYNAYCWRNQGRYQVPLRCYFPWLILLLWTRLWDRWSTSTFCLLGLTPVQDSKLPPTVNSAFKM